MPSLGQRDFTAKLSLAKRKVKKGGDSTYGRENERRSRERGDWIKNGGSVR
jgi:hypothetical protein